MAKQVHDKKFCLATTRAGTPCRRPAGWGTNHPGSGRCKLHGGASTGAPKNNNAEKHGLWRKHLPEETLDLVDELQSEDKINNLKSRALTRDARN